VAVLPRHQLLLEPARGRAGRATVNFAMFRLTCIATAVAVLLVTAVAPAAAQEPRLPDGVVARVGEETISEREFRHWLRIGVRGQGPPAPPLEPPRFERCVAAELRIVEEGEPTPSRRELRLRCRTRYEALRTSTMLQLVHGVWTRQEAAARRVAVSPDRLRRALERQKREEFPTERAFRAFLRSTGMKETDLLERIEFDMLQRRLTRSAAADVPVVTKEDVNRHYARHRRRYDDMSPASARHAIRVQLTAGRRQRAITRFIDEFRSRYRKVTTCAKGYVMDACSNGR
jgi:hypothetical protein